MGIDVPSSKMETHMRPIPRSFALLAVLLICPSGIPAARESRRRTGSFSVSESRFAQLSRRRQAGPQRFLGSARHLSVQTVSVRRSTGGASPEMRGWNPASHPDLKVYLHVDSGSNFSALRRPRHPPSATSPSDFAAFRDLQLSAAEMKLLPARTSPVSGRKS